MGVRVDGFKGLLALAAAAAAACALLAAASPAEARSKCASTSALPESISITKAERSVFCLINKKRGQHDLPRLERQGELDRASRDHSRLMVDDGCFAHECPGEPSVFERLVDAGYLTRLDGVSWGYAENLAWGSGSLGTPKAIVRAWMRSEGHRRNILTRDFEQIGVGLVWGSPAGTSVPAATYTTDFGYRRR